MLLYRLETDIFKNGRDPLTTADTEGGRAIFQVMTAQFGDQSDGQARAAGSQRMANRDRAAIDVRFLAIQAKLFLYREILGRERLVDLHTIQVRELEIRALESLANSRRRTDTHDIGRHAHNSPRDQASLRLQIIPLDRLPGREDHTGPGVV